MDYTKNNNQKIIARLAIRSFESNIGRNITAIITITFSVCIVLSMTLAALSTYQMKYNSVKDEFQAAIRSVSDKELKLLEGISQIQKVGVSYFLDYVQANKGDVYFVYYNEVMLESLPDIRGTYPNKEDEVLVSQTYLNMTGQNINIGGTIKLDTKNIKGNFKVTGIMDESALMKNTISLFFSKPFLDRFMGNDSIKYNAFIWLDDAYKHKTENVARFLYPVIGTMLERVNINIPYFQYAGQFWGSDSSLSVIIAGVLILFAVAIVVYSMFYISVDNKIREYGQLRTLGATKKQIKKIVVYEGMSLAAIGGAVGILLGCIVGYSLQPVGWTWINTFKAVLAVALFEILVIWLSIRTPAKLAGNASPTEAGKFLNYTANGKHTNKIKTTHKKSTPIRIAFLNVTRNSKKSTLTMLSLGISGILFISAASLQTNITAEKHVRYRELPYGDYKLTLVGGDNDDFSEIQQLNNPLNDEMRQRILSIDGVEGIYEWKKISGLLTTVDNTTVNTQINIFGIAPQDEKKLTDALSEGTADYDALSKNNGLIIYSTGASIHEFGGWVPHTGDTITFRTLSGNGEYVENIIPVMCIIDKHKNFKGNIMMTNSALQQITGTDCTESWEIITDSSDNSDIGQQITMLSQNNPNIRLTTYSTELTSWQLALNSGFGMFFLLALLLGVFGVINLTNTNITSIISRKHEIGILQAVGMTKKQMSISLLSEGLFNTVTATLITVSIGFPAGYMACYLFNKDLIAVYSFPWQPSLLYFAALSIVQLLLNIYNIRMISKTVTAL